MVTNEQLETTTALTPAELERRKSAEERAQDVAYTINHALSCGVTDAFIQAPISEWVVRQGAKGGGFSKLFQGLDRFFEKHDHAHDDHPHGEHYEHHASHADHPHEDGHRHHAETHTSPALHVHKKGIWHGMSHWLQGEAVGDIGGIVPTILLQRHVPGFMHGLRTILEPVAGWAFRSGAKRDAHHWASKNGFAPDSPETIAKEKALYEHEVSHLPQAVMWNMFSIPINLFTQKKILKSNYTWGELIVGKTFGSLFSNTVLIGTRALAPEAVHKWDTFNSDHVIKPTSRVIGSMFGVDHKTMDEAADKHVGKDRDWQGRVQDQPLQDRTVANV